jgi:HEAT repeat protein
VSQPGASGAGIPPSGPPPIPEYDDMDAPPARRPPPPAQAAPPPQQPVAPAPKQRQYGPDLNLPSGHELPDVDVDASLKKRRGINPAMVLLALLLAALGGGLVWYGLRTEQKKMTVEQRMEEQKNIFVLPAKDQIPRWRQWAVSTENLDLQCEAMSQLAFLKDPEGIKLAIQSLSQPEHKIHGTAAQVLAYYGSPAADAGKAPLLKALETADDSDRRQVVWALVALKEPTVFSKALELYRSGELTTVQRLEGGGAFDPEMVAALVSLDELAKLADDPSGSVRQLVAKILSDNAGPKWTSALVKLVQDKEQVVAQEAASGLGRIADESARGPLLEALRKADKDSRTKFLEAMRDGIGGEGLVLALDTVVKEPEATNWFQTKQLFDMLGILADPRAGDSLIAWVERSKPHAHWRAEAGIRLVEIGDIRGAKYIAERMGLEGKDIYVQEKFWQADAGGHLLKGDLQRIVGMRMLADLPVMFADKKPELAEVASEPVMKWLTNRPQPHANGLRFLAQADVKSALPKLREWAFPKEPLPAEGAQPPFPPAFETAQSALRYVGRMHDQDSFDKLVEQFERKKDKKMDITEEGLMGAGLAMLGMALRAVAYGAADGLAEWGEIENVEKIEDKLYEFIEDPLWHLDPRFAACNALAWIGNDKTVKKVAEKVAKFAAEKDPKLQLVGACYAQTLARRPSGEIVPMLVDLMRPELAINVRDSIGYAIGVAGVAPGSAAEQKLFELLKNPEVRNGAALALVLGGAEDTAARTVAMYADFGKEALDQFKDIYFIAFGYWTDKDLDRGNLYRWVRNAEAISRVKIGDAPQEWANQRLRAQFDSLQWDNGPHSETRVVLRFRLVKAAREGTPEQKVSAIQTLKFMKEQGPLMALRHEKGETGTLASKAFHELMNPRLAEQDDLGKFKKEKDKGKSNP